MLCCFLYIVGGYIIAPTFATFTLSFDNCLPKLWASLYRQLAAMHICCIFLLKIWLLTCYIIMVLYFVSTIIKWPLSTITLCVLCSKLAQGSASMYYIHIEHQQGIHVNLVYGLISQLYWHKWMLVYIFFDMLLSSYDKRSVLPSTPRSSKLDLLSPSLPVS